MKKIFWVKTEDIWSPGRFRKIVEARIVLCYWAVREIGVSMTMLSIKIGISVAAISGFVIRGQKIVEEKGLKIIKLYNLTAFFLLLDFSAIYRHNNSMIEF